MGAALVLGSAAVVGACFVLWWALSGSETGNVRLEASAPPATTDLRTATLRLGASERAIDPLIAKVGQLMRRYTAVGRQAAIERRLLRAGSPRGWTVERVLAAKAGAAALGTVLGTLVLVGDPGVLAVVLLLAFSVLGYFLPDILLKNSADKRQEQIRRTLSETVDQIGIVVEAGMGIDAAIARVSTTSTGPLADELARVVQDTRAGIPRADALTAMAERAPTSELRQFVTAVVQAERLGVPIVQSLRVQARELRRLRHQLAEEQAAKLPVKILFPTALFVFPCLFIVLLAPAVIDILDAFGGG